MEKLFTSNTTTQTGLRCFLPVKLRSLSEKVTQLKHEFFSRRRQLHLDQRESVIEYEELREEWVASKEQGCTLAEEKEIADIELSFVVDDSFWRQIHRKHVMEDLVDLKKRQRVCLADCKSVLTQELKSPATRKNSAAVFLQNAKSLFLKMCNRLRGADVGDKDSTVLSKSMKRQKRRNDTLNELVLDLEEAYDGVDELVIRQYATYEKQVNPFCRSS